MWYIPLRGRHLNRSKLVLCLSPLKKHKRTSIVMKNFKLYFLALILLALSTNAMRGQTCNATVTSGNEFPHVETPISAYARLTMRATRTGLPNARRHAITYDPDFGVTSTSATCHQNGGCDRSRLSNRPPHRLLGNGCIDVEWSNRRSVFQCFLLGGAANGIKRYHRSSGMMII